MYFQYGTYQHDTNEASVTLDKSTQRTPRGIPVKETWTMRVSGSVLAESTSEMNTKLSALESAYSRSGRDATLYLANGQPTTRKLTNTNSLNGVQVVKPVSYPEGRHVYATRTPYVVVLQAEYRITGGQELLYWQETISYQGNGGPRIVWRECLDVAPVPQVVAPATLSIVTQAGVAVGKSGYPLAPNPLVSGINYDGPNSSQTYAGPEDGQTGYETSWQYVMKFPGNEPTLRPRVR